jgi:hypothetical protein
LQDENSSYRRVPSASGWALRVQRRLKFRAVRSCASHIATSLSDALVRSEAKGRKPGGIARPGTEAAMRQPTVLLALRRRPGLMCVKNPYANSHLA